MGGPMSHVAAGIRISGAGGDNYDQVLTSGALEFIADLQRELSEDRTATLQMRRERQAAVADGMDLDFLPQTVEIRSADWVAQSAPPGLIDRRVEITGPTSQKMTINALNSGANVWMADFEDSHVPTWTATLDGQVNLSNVLDRKIDFEAPDGRKYELTTDQLPTIAVRPRGWHLVEKHLMVDGNAVSASLFDFGLYVYHCSRRQISSGKGPYLYLPKLESHEEARLWRAAFTFAEDSLGLARGTIRATVLIETLPAAFEMDEIVYELRDHCAGLNAGRWDYLFSVIKTYGGRSDKYVLPDRNSLGMTVPFMRAYTDLLVQTCHRRGVHAIGGMAPFIPNRQDAELNARALAQVREDKLREATDGFDGSWVAHPDLVAVCREAFDGVLGEDANQIYRVRDEVRIGKAQLQDFDRTTGQISESGLRNNVSIALVYLASWLKGRGAVTIFNLMEDVATAEIARSQLWQWLRNSVTLSNGQVVTADLVRRMINEESTKVGSDAEARALLEQLVFSDHFEEFLTTPAYALLP